MVWCWLVVLVELVSVVACLPFCHRNFFPTFPSRLHDFVFMSLVHPIDICLVLQGQRGLAPAVLLTNFIFFLLFCRYGEH